MGFETYEESRSRGAPNTLYLFDYMGKVFGYTDSEFPITFDDVDYLPLPVERDTVTASGTLDKSTLSIKVPHDCEVAELFRVYPPSAVVNATVFQGHQNDEDAEFLAVWVGRVISCAREDSIATLACEPVSTSLRRTGLRRRYQYGCPHALYGPQCQVEKALFSVEAEVTAVGAGLVTFSSGWNGAFDEERFADGLIEWTADDATQLRTILQVDTGLNRLTIGGTTTGLLVGDTVTLSLGCSHQMADCNAFENIQNFGGQPFIPSKNPIGFKSAIYY